MNSSGPAIFIPEFYCPIASCIASSSSNGCLKTPLLELPIDQNHVKLLCPHCKVLVTQCDACYSLIRVPDNVDNEGSVLVEHCRKCGFPNLFDSQLRQFINFPRNCPLLYNTARVIQTAISKPLYIKYKMIEHENIVSIFTHPNGPHQNSPVIPGEHFWIEANSSASSSKPTHHHQIISLNNENMDIRESSIADQSVESNANELAEEEISQTHPKKRKRDQLSYFDPHGEISDSNDEKSPLPTNKRMFDRQQTGQVEPHFELHKSPETTKGLNFHQWSSQLTISPQDLCQIIQLQYRMLVSGKTKALDQAAWKVMHFKERTRCATLAHFHMLEALYTSENHEAIANNSVWNKVKQFSASKAELLRLKFEAAAAERLSSPNGPLTSILAGDYLPSNLQAVILSIFSAKATKIRHIFELRSREHWALLQNGSSELKRLYKETADLLAPQAIQNPPYSNNQKSALSEHISEEIRRDNSLEQRKCMILLWTNLYRTVSATAL